MRFLILYSLLSYINYWSIFHCTYNFYAKVEIKSGNGKYGAIELIDKRFREFGVEERSQRKPE